MQALPVGDDSCAGGNIAGCSNGGVATAEGTACERGARFYKVHINTYAMPVMMCNECYTFW